MFLAIELEASRRVVARVGSRAIPLGAKSRAR